MSLDYQGDVLTFDTVSLADLADTFGTPCYVYSEKVIRNNWAMFADAFRRQSHSICYAVKANANPAILRLLKDLGSGFDVVSAGEMRMVLDAGADPDKIVFSGVGKSRDDITFALERGAGCINVESHPELERIEEIAGQLGKTASVAIRANPDIDAGTHPYIATGLEQNKFGVPMDQVAELAGLTTALTHVELRGLACHIGSQIKDCTPFAQAAASLEALRVTLATNGFEIDHMDLGGGLAATTDAPSISDWIGCLETNISDHVHLQIEPGRSMVGNAGVLLTRVEYLKRTSAKNFAIVDAGMNDFLRPALYEGWHEVKPCYKNHVASVLSWDIVGPVCESSDFLAHERMLSLDQDDLLALTSTGAYGYVMSSTYNGRPRPAEVLIRANGDTELVRERQRDLT